MRRRRFLRAGAGTAGAATLAGCLSSLGFETETAGGEPPLVEDRPDAVYYPTHVEGMEMIGMGGAGGYRVGLLYSYPHRFWTVTGPDRQRVDIGDDDSVHLMATLWDPETEVVLPVGAGLTTTVTRDGEAVVEKPPWPMLSQNMGFHYGDNYALPGEGTYDVEVRVAPAGTRLSGAFEGRFAEAGTATIAFEFDPAAMEEIPYRQLSDQQGQRGAVSPMEMGMMPLSVLPAADDLPGRVLGEATSGDGRFVVVALDEPPVGVEGDGAYLAVSARTPYNRYPLPFMAIDATLTRAGTTAFEGALSPTLHEALGYHYGAAVDRLDGGEGLELSVTAPPQVARHEGYETAFLSMDPMTLSLG